LLPGSTLNGATITAPTCCGRIHISAGTFTVERYDGSDSYNAGTIQLQKRFSNGNSSARSTPRSSLRDELNYLNSMDGQLEDRVSPNDRPHRFSIAA
jgi:hypothetical protein